MAIRLVRKTDGKVFATRQSADWEGWKPDYVQPTLRTIAGVMLPQKISVLQWVTDTQWRFDSKHATMHTGRMYELIVAAHRLTIFRYTDLDGFTYDVQVLEKPDPKRDQRITTYNYHTLDLKLLRLGFST